MFLLAIIILFCILFIINIIVFTCGFYPEIICTLAYFGAYFVMYAYFVGMIITIITTICIKKFKIAYVIILLILFIDMFGFKYIYHYERGYNEVNKYLQAHYSNYKILGIDKVKFEEKDAKDVYGKYIYCDYTFNVEVDNDFIIQAGFCDRPYSYFGNTYSDNYNSIAVPYFFNKYKKNKSTNIRILPLKYKFIDDYVTIEYDDTEKKEVTDFLKYLYSNVDIKMVRVMIYNIDTDESKYINDDLDIYLD